MLEIFNSIFNRRPSKAIFRKCCSLKEYRSEKKICKKCEKIAQRIIKSQKETSLKGYCAYCRKRKKMKIDFKHSWEDKNGNQIPNFRERLECFRCGLNSRLRATLHFLNTYYNDKNLDVYITEEITPLFDILKEKYPRLTGSEFQSEKENGEKIKINRHSHKIIHNQNLTSLTFSNEVFDLVLSFDVFEHIPDYQKSFKEIYRVLKKNGTLIFSVPFIMDAEKNLTRAKVKNGLIDYLLPPEYHGDPVNNNGCLSYYHFGWEILQDLKHNGFNEAGTYIYQSADYGYINEGLILYAKKL
jgi:SAM-dependent methyltransferase